MNSHQIGIIRKMIDLTDKCLVQSGCRLNDSILSLENLIDLLETKDLDFIDYFYDLWGPLEIFNAIHEDQDEYSVKNKSFLIFKSDLKSMKNFLLGYLNKYYYYIKINNN